MKIKNTSLTLWSQQWLTQPLHRLRQQLPHRCLLCFQQTQDYRQQLCQNCRSDLPYPSYLCIGCAATLVTDIALCGSCLHTPPRYPLITASDYLSPIKELISSLKYRRNTLAAFELAHHLSRRIEHNIEQGHITKPALLIPVPLHRMRLLSRGFNQAELIARSLGQLLDIPVATPCQRHIATSAQAQLNAKQRRHNLDGAFKITTAISATSIALVDDVYTTGATMNELAATINQQQSIDIQYWCIARTLI